MSTKVIKDSVHGYISIDDRFIPIIDSAEFQRLKWIEQGSFRVLYPAARHDRFIHSLGTYHLANIISAHFIDNIKKDMGSIVSNLVFERVRMTFLYASLLHDIGHAPFSHTCENFFKIRTATNQALGASEIENELLEAVKSIPGKSDGDVNRFISEYKGIGPSAHEIVSATLLIRYADLFRFSEDLVDLELAARMVTGCTFEYNTSGTDNDVLGIKNCFIRLLNSSSVDVDKLDYITRDAKMSGFTNVPIDIDRLTRSVTAIKDESGHIRPAFQKNVLSVIDNVFKAKSDESTWMVSHPVVAYDSALLKVCVQSLGGNYLEDVFSSKALGSDGKEYNGTTYRLISDMDVISDLKRKYKDCSAVHEFFERSARRHPIWKSFHEYRHIFGDLLLDHERNIDKINQFFSPLISYISSNGKFEINESLLELLGDTAGPYAAASLLKNFADQYELKFDFVVLSASSSFSPKIDPSQIYIRFNNLPGGIGSSRNYSTYAFLKNENNSGTTNNFFYLYSRDRLTAAQISGLRNMIKDKIERPVRVWS